MQVEKIKPNKKLNSGSLIAVIGAGAMGAGIAQVAAQAGHKVFLYDQDERTIFKAKEAISLQLNKRVIKGKMSQVDYDACLENIIPAYRLEELAEVDLVIEAIVEHLEVKQTLFIQLEAICSKQCIFTSNTSSISITAIASKLEYPQRFLGLHFFNPAPVMPLVEIISGLASDLNLAKSLYQTCLRWGKKPVYAKSTPGFIVNRVARPFYAEALRVYEEQGTSIEQLDLLIRESGQFRMGPFELMDLIGHDVNYAVTQSVFSAYYQDSRFKPSQAQKALVDAGFLGRKTGRGFYQYDKAGIKLPCSLRSNLQRESGQKEQDNALKQLRVIKASPLAEGQTNPTNKLFERFLGANFFIDSDFTINPDQLVIESFQFAETHFALTDGKSATERSVTDELNNLILFDLAFDYDKVKVLGFSVADNCSEAAIQDAIHLFNLIGIQLIQLDDVAGLVLMRTLAMLTNEAADTCLQGVATAEDIDLAMCAGVNYPEGPLSWGERVGVRYIHNVLINLQHHYGEERYRPSSLLRRLSFANKGFFKR